MRFVTSNLLRPRALALPLVAAWAALCGPANAQFQPGFTGWTEFADAGSSAGGVVDFAVYQNTGADGGNWVSQLGLGSSIASAGVLDSSGGSTVDSTASYVFFYEVVNTAPAAGNGSIANFNVNSYTTPYTSGGWLNNYVFNDMAVTNTHPYIGTQPTGTPPDNQQYYYPSAMGQSLDSATPFTNSGVSTTAPTGVASLGGADNGGQATFQWTTFFGNHLLTANHYSPVLFLTSNTTPSYAPGSLSSTSGMNPSDGNIPTQAPEPATLLMWGAGALGVAVMIRRRRKLAAGVIA
ncbi:MAG TPA: PEP-CTERM sorting domain-containing protein [Pirellulales bacterium]|nr:PEP-CTERM sorting domain-containing protein [Pirellulales bacterium]